MKMTASKLILRLAVAFVILLVVMLGCLLVGSQTLSISEILRGPDADVPNVDFEIFLYVRLPRIFLAAIVGAALACAGVVFQAILRNPLADPYILGVSSGAGLGYMLAVFFGWTWALDMWGLSPTVPAAFIGAMATVWLVWVIGKTTGRQNVTGLLLAGVVVNAFFSAVIMFLASIAEAQELQSVMFRLMGNFEEFNCVLPLMASFVIVFVGMVVLTLMGNRLNILSFGSQDARSLGVPIEKTYFWAFAVAALITAVAVSLSGLVGFVGLLVPHAIRLVAGPDHRQLIPLSAIVGATFLVIADAFARTVIAPAMLPVGVVTALTGGPFFLFLLLRFTKRIHWGRS
ncbi:MAG: FecCD family ABC transporter permease [Planctomycetota bacterium]|jgi:iron complex transport system permease protein